MANGSGGATGESSDPGLWATISRPGPVTNALNGWHKSDFAIVGAGIAGLSAALFLAKAGIRTVVLDSKSPGAGATGESGGLLAPDFIRHTPSEIESLFGKEQGSRLIELVGSASIRTRELIEENNIACGLQTRGFWIPAHTRRTAMELDARAREWRSRGFGVRSVDAEETCENLGSPRYCGAIKFEEGGALNPVALCRELANIVIGKGATLFCDSAVLSVQRRAEMWQLTTKYGCVETRNVILAANGGNAEIHPMLKNTVLPFHVHEYATRPLSDKERELVLPSRAAFTDKQHYLFTARYDDDGRLISALPDVAFVRGRSRIRSEAQRAIFRHFPALGKELDIQRVWRGTAWLHPTLLPRLTKLDDNAIAIQACNGRGLGNNMALGQQVAAYMSGASRDIAIRPEPPQPIRFYGVAQFMPETLMTLAYIQNKMMSLRELGSDI